MIAIVVFVGVRRAGGEWLAGELFLIGVAAEVVFFFKQQPIFVSEKIAGGESGHAAADDYRRGFFCGSRAVEDVQVSHLVTDFKMFAIHARCWRGGIRGGQEGGVDGASRGYRSDHYVLNEVTTRRRHKFSPKTFCDDFF